MTYKVRAGVSLSLLPLYFLLDVELLESPFEKQRQRKVNGFERLLFPMKTRR